MADSQDMPTPQSALDDRDYWTNASADRPQLDTMARLQSWTKKSNDLRGFVLRRCDLSGINLSKTADHPQGYRLQGADLYRANFSHAHLFSADLSGAVLMKANFNAANLQSANLENANLLGIELDHAKLHNIRWGDRILQEQQALAEEKSGHREQAADLYLEAEETYRNLRIHLERSGLFERAGDFFHREMVMRRKQMTKPSSARAISYLVDIFCGYGEKPIRVVLFSLAFIVFCAACYFFAAGVIYQGQELGLNTRFSLMENLNHFISCLYFSVVTFTTLGYGDVTPVGATRAIAAVEAFAGSFTMALYVVVFVKKMTR